MKTCTGCKQERALDQFYTKVRPSGTIRYEPRCKPCTREQNRAYREANADFVDALNKAFHEQFKDKYNQARNAVYKTRSKEIQLKRRAFKYGITEDHLVRLLRSDRCSICASSEPGTKGWQIDHCHSTGSVRGVLCMHCNLMLGHARDNPAILSSAINYLQLQGTP